MSEEGKEGVVHRASETAEAVIGHQEAEDASPAPFDPADPFDSQCERLRREVVQIVIDSENITLYREMTAQRQLECMVAGLLTGLISSAFASIFPTEEAHDYIMDYIIACIPVARRFVDMLEEPSEDPSIT